MTALNEAFETFVSPQNVRFMSFIPVELLPLVQGGEIPDMQRTLSL